ncbi:MAG: TonB-dependent receptor [Sphingomonas sp.]|uniref:TonB-dependent receptor plug domain-containing protein n=1 Tax=Sphingomonas sp. TaxID=28214 RepID=UPI0022730470|nr:TonB-dependent receptor [Sphingomonas sp.]MCX8474780.1 TonB-dependent receptor [Sphingomonas sp.]
MNKHIHARLLATVALLSPVPAIAQQQQATALPTVDVTSEHTGGEAGESRDRERIARDAVRTSDTAAIVRDLPGVSAYDAGGVASLPVIRGLEADRIAILVDGVRIDDVCPNKMAPPLSFTDPQTVRTISALTGVTPVSLGGDTIGGAISVETLPSRFAASGATLFTGRASAFYRSNGDGFGGALSLTAASDKLSLTYNGSYTQSANYEGGGDDGVVRSSEYAKTDHAVAFAARTDIGQFELKAGFQRAPREGFPNQYMDMTDNRSWFVSGRYRGVFDWGDADLSVHYRDTDHEMNFLEDKGGTANGGMPMLTETHIAGYALKLRFPLSVRDTLGIGSEFHHQWLDDHWPPVAGSMMMGPNTYVNINAATRDRLGSYLEWERAWDGRLSTVIGIRQDRLWMNTGTVQPYSTGMMSMADAAAATAFNAAERRRRDSNWSGSAIARYAPSERVALEFGYARKVRSPNIYERYSWGRGSMSSRMIGWFGDGNGYVGKLDLAPERADTLSAAATFSGAGERSWTLRLAPYFTHVADYVDVVRIKDLTDAMGRPTGFVQLQFANGEARFYGLDVSGTLPLWENARVGSARLSLAASWAQGDNLADGGALYHQMPFHAKLRFDHKLGGWESHAALAWVADKTRVDATRNEPRTDGYALVNLGTSYGWSNLRLSLDVENLLDAAYDLPLGGVSLGDYRASGEVRRVPGRGRSVNLGMSVRF